MMWKKKNWDLLHPELRCPIQGKNHISEVSLLTSGNHILDIRRPEKKTLAKK